MNDSRAGQIAKDIRPVPDVDLAQAGPSVPVPAQSEEAAQKRTGSIGSFLKELPLLVVIALIVAWVIKSFLIQPFYIPSASMEPTFMPGDHVLVNKFIYRYSEPERGDVLVFKFPLDQSKDYIKRVIASGGERVELRGGKVLVNGKPIKESYTRRSFDVTPYGPRKVDKGEFFVLGDNRGNSADSRVWGLLPKDNILGKAFFVYWPPDRIGLVR